MNKRSQTFRCKNQTVDVGRMISPVVH